MGFEELITDDWMESASNIYNAFLDWFTSLDLAGQIITGILLVLALVAAGYIVYGSLWLAYQVTKASIIASIIIVYLTIVGIVLSIQIIIAIFDGIEQEKVVHTWNMSIYHIKYLLVKAYPSEQRELPDKPVLKAKSAKAISYGQKVQNPEKPVAPVILVEEKEVRPVVEENSHEPITPEKYFCPNCGIEFTPRMINMLEGNTFTFCEACGEKFYRRETEQA